MTIYRVDSRWCRVFPAMLLAVLAIAPSAMPQQRKAQPPKSVRLYVFDCGSLNIPDVSPYQLKTPARLVQAEAASASTSICSAQ